MTQEEFDSIVAAVADRVTSRITESVSAAVTDSVAPFTKEVLTIDEASRYSGISKNYIYKLTASRMIPYSKPTGGAVFFSRPELEAWLMSNPIATQTEIDRKAQMICMRRRSIV